MIGDVAQLEERQERLERVMQMLGVTPEYPYTFNINDGTRNRVLIGLIGSDYGIQIVDNSGNSVLLANGTVVANAIKTGTLDCSLITVSNLNAGSITTGTLSASFINGGTLNCSLMTVTNLNAASITVGTFVSINSRLTDEAIDGVKITQNTIYGNRIVANSINADRIQAGTITADRITAKTITADRIQDYSLGTGQMIINGVNGDRITDLTITNAKISTISADKLTAGTIYVGYAGRPVAMYIAHGSSGDAKFWFEGGSRMWSDSSNRIGINSIGSPMYIYVNSSERIIIPSSGQTVIKDGISCQGNFNMTTGSARFSGDITTEGSVSHNNVTSISIGGNTIDASGGSLYLFKSITAYNTTEFYLSGGTPKIKIGGSEKTAIVPTSKGYRSLYCMESPETWFMDFCDQKEDIDPLFLEVTEGEKKFIKVEGGGYMVLRRRKHHAQKRFEQKTEEEYLANERFLGLARVTS